MKKLLLFTSLLFCTFISNAQLSGFPTTVVINEVDYDHQGTDSLEFIELYNNGTSPVPLNQFRILFYTEGGTQLYDSLQLPVYTLNPGAFYVIAGAGGWVPNYNILMSDTFEFIQNGAASSTSGTPDAIAIQITGTTVFVDVVSYEGSCTAPYLENTGLAYLNSDYNNAADIGISRYPDGTDTQNNSVDFSRKCITPGVPNVATGTNCGGTVGINQETKTGLNIYPNPANDFVNISTGTDKGDVMLIVYDFTGKMIDTKLLKNAASTFQYNTAQFAEGVYILNIKTSDTTVTKKLTVLHR